MLGQSLTGSLSRLPEEFRTRVAKRLKWEEVDGAGDVVELWKTAE